MPYRKPHSSTHSQPPILRRRRRLWPNPCDSTADIPTDSPIFQNSQRLCGMPRESIPFRIRVSSRRGANRRCAPHARRQWHKPDRKPRTACKQTAPKAKRSLPRRLLPRRPGDWRTSGVAIRPSQMVLSRRRSVRRPWGKRASNACIVCKPSPRGAICASYRANAQPHKTAIPIPRRRLRWPILGPIHTPKYRASSRQLSHRPRRRNADIAKRSPEMPKIYVNVSRAVSTPRKSLYTIYARPSQYGARSRHHSPINAPMPPSRASPPPTYCPAISNTIPMRYAMTISILYKPI